jgi:hypothetical protein
MPDIELLDAKDARCPPCWRSGRESKMWKSGWLPTDTHGTRRRNYRCQVCLKRTVNPIDINTGETIRYSNGEEI